GVFEKANLAAPFFPYSDTERIIAHLDDPQLAVGSEGERDRIEDERLGCHQLDFESGTDVNGFQRRGGGIWLRRPVGHAEQFVKRPAINQVEELRRVFVLPEEMSRMDEEPVVGAVGANDGRQLELLFVHSLRRSATECSPPSQGGGRGGGAALFLRD